ncbi:MAG: hypothetical protein NTW96_17390 [Planctomycetia bacterium]|nr:hypothetical protein [Planctomycetia bacterium]
MDATLSDAALSDEDSVPWQIGLERLGRQLLPFGASTRAALPRPSLHGHVPAPNWVSSYLPDLEFCTVLGRFRL